MDASWNATTKSGNVGVVIRDLDCKFVVATESSIKASRVQVAESMAILEGCSLAKQLGLGKIIIETDSKETVLCLNNSK